MKLKRDTVLSGRYNIRALLGEGGMGVVYRAFDEQLRRTVAIKTIQGDKASDKDFLRRFKREAQAISSIDHPHIVRLLDFVEGSDGQDPFMVMEMLTGKDMSTVIREQGALDLTRAVTRVLEASIAIGECHRHGYLHRDVKPNNIFLHEYNQVEAAKVLDFGAAKQDEHFDGQHDDTADVTKKGFILGTPYYMPPEQIAGRPATAKSDQYSLAVVLYMAVTGRKPFQVKTPKQDFRELDLLQLIRKGDYTPVQRARPEVPATLAEAIQKAMSVDPEKRYPDLHSFGGAIRSFASPQAKLTWEAHFTSEAPARRAPQLSMAMSAHNGTEMPNGSLDAPTVLDPTFSAPDDTRGTAPTVRAKATNETIALATGELKEAAGEPNLATTTKRPADAPSRSLSLVIDEASESVASFPSSSSSLRPASETTSRSFTRNTPGMIVLAALAMLGSALVVSFLLSHRKEPAPILLAPPADLMDRHATAPSQPPLPSHAPAAAVAAPRPAPPPAPGAPRDLDTGTSAVAAEVRAAPTPVEAPRQPATTSVPKHHVHKKSAAVVERDSHGIPIPTD